MHSKRAAKQEKYSFTFQNHPQKNKHEHRNFNNTRKPGAIITVCGGGGLLVLTERAYWRRLADGNFICGVRRDRILDGQDYDKRWSTGAQVQAALGIHVGPEPQGGGARGADAWTANCTSVRSLVRGRHHRVRWASWMQ